MTLALALWLAYGLGNAVAQFRAAMFARVLWVWQLGRWRRGEL